MIKDIGNYEGLNITYQVTNDCGLNCIYCYELNKNPEDLPIEYANKFTDLILNDPDPIGAMNTDNQWILEKGLVMDFIGGDALMKPVLLDEILKYYIFQSTILRHKWANRWRASISTNGTLFGNPKVKYFMEKYKENLSVGVSIDGCPEIHDQNRKMKNGDGSMKEILKYWDWFVKYTEGYITTKSTLNKDSIPYIYKSIKYMHETLGLKYIRMNFIFENMNLSQNDLKQLDEQLGLSSEYILKHKNDLYVGLFDKRNKDHNDTIKNMDKSWCGAGSMPCLAVNGKIYPCFRFTPINMHNTEYDLFVGDIWKGFYKKENFNVLRDQTRKKVSLKMCLDCSEETGCAWCIASSYAESGKFYRQTNICEIHKLQTKWSKYYWEQYDLSKSK
jgi:uncharacterized protein